MNPIFPSVLSSDFFTLEERLLTFRRSGVQVIHLDIMDGHFVDNISFGPNMARAVKSRFPFELDAHLMVDDPVKVVPWFIEAGCEWISFHAETVVEAVARDLLASIRHRQRRAGLVLNPDTPLERAIPLLDQLDYLLLMSVFPGYGGQSFIPETLARIRSMRVEIERRNPGCRLQVDGGIRADNIAAVRAAGADLFVVGTSLYNSADVSAALQKLFQQVPWSPT